MKLQKTTGQPKDPWLATRAPHSTTPQVQYIGRTEETIQQEKPIQKSQTWEELKELRIKKLHAEIDFSIDKMVSCHISNGSPKSRRGKI